MNKFLYLVFVLESIVFVNCFGASVTVNIHNALTEEVVKLVPKGSTCTYFKEQEIIAGKDKPLKVDVLDFKPADSPEKAQVLFQVNVVIMGKAVGVICLIQGVLPNPIFWFGNSEDDLDYELRTQRQRFGGGPTTIEIVRKEGR